MKKEIISPRKSLAINGGQPVRTKPFPDRRQFDVNETRHVMEALRNQNLFFAGGQKVYQFVREYKKLFGVKHAVPSTSGTSAIHVAVGAINPNPGDEIIVTPISDMGSVAPIILCGAIPVFADLELETFNLDPADVARKVTKRTKAIIAVHCWGRPVNLDAIMKIARKHKIAVIEDCAQSHYIRYKGRLTGTIGDLGAFSFQQSKHITCGDGGVTLVNRDKLAQRAEIYVDKGCDWTEDRKYRKHYAFIAPCYRMTELQGAVLCAQVRKLPSIAGRRQKIGGKLVRKLQGIKGVYPPPAPDKTYGHGYWGFPMRIVEEEIGVSRDKFTEALAREGVSGGSWMGKMLYQFEALRDQITFGNSHWPFAGTNRGRLPRYKKGLCPNAEKAMSQLLSIGINERWTDKDIDDTAKAVRKVAAGLATK